MSLGLELGRALALAQSLAGAGGCCLVIMTVCVTLQPTRIQFYCQQQQQQACNFMRHLEKEPQLGLARQLFLLLLLALLQLLLVRLVFGFSLGANLIQLRTHLIVIFMRLYSWMCLAFYVEPVRPSPVSSVLLLLCDLHNLQLQLLLLQQLPLPLLLLLRCLCLI